MKLNKPFFDIIIIGGGIVGLASAYKIQSKWPYLNLLILEKEAHAGVHQTGHNSGVLHSGVYYKPGSSKALNCRDGLKQMIAFAEENEIPYDICGKIIVATQVSELSQLDDILETGKQNGLKNVRKITAEEIQEIEPYCEGVAGIFVGDSGIIDYQTVAKTLAKKITSINPTSQIRFNQEVISIKESKNGHILKTASALFKTKYMVFCGGLFSDRLAKKQGIKTTDRIVGFRGDYYELTPQAQHKVKHLIYPVPNPQFPFLGVHFTRMINGGIECGPNAVFTFKREGYRRTSFNLKDTYESLSYSGTWRLFFKHWRFGIEEYRRAFSKRKFLRTLQGLIPSLTLNDIQPARSGVRAVLLNEAGDTRTDFKIEFGKDSIHILNAPSPAATASLAIGDRVVEMVEEKFKLQ
ncbi:L-2-hydroxyglutarate oxidase [Gangjinia marincola]|uniref:L-2-hydroxyglutarate oxidase n=1 Tax=Gangjinia marincola TaxID=578463 RepID=A0ABN1MG07_9FLAO